MSDGPARHDKVDVRRGVREAVVASLVVLAVAVAVAAVVFGLIVVLYDHGQPVAHAAIGAALPRP